MFACGLGTPGAKRPSPDTSRRPRAPRSRQRADIIRGVDRCRTPPVRMSYFPHTSAYAEARWKLPYVSKTEPLWTGARPESDRGLYPTPKSLQRNASAGNRTRGESMATIHFTTKPLMRDLPGARRARPARGSRPPRLQSYALPLSYRPPASAQGRPGIEPGTIRNALRRTALGLRARDAASPQPNDDGGIRTHARRPVP